MQLCYKRNADEFHLSPYYKCITLEYTFGRMSSSVTRVHQNTSPPVRTTLQCWRSWWLACHCCGSTAYMLICALSRIMTRWIELIARTLNRSDTISSGLGWKLALMNKYCAKCECIGFQCALDVHTSGSAALNLSCLRRKSITVWNAVVAVNLNFFCFNSGALPVCLKNITTSHTRYGWYLSLWYKGGCVCVFIIIIIIFFFFSILIIHLLPSTYLCHQPCIL